MKLALLAVLSVVLLSGCGGAGAGLPAEEVFAQDEIYEGYPCQDECEHFQQGYDEALRQGIDDEEKCMDEVLSRETGCKAFVKDYEFENKSFEELLESF